MSVIKNNRWSITLAAFMIGCFLVLEGAAVRRAQALPSDTYHELETFANVLAIVQKNYVEPVTTKIRLTLHRTGLAELFNVTLARDVIKIKSVKSKVLPEGYGYVRVTTFQESTDDAVEHAIDDFSKQDKGKIKGVVLDLRDNPG